jgi:hypothetical protein
MRRWRFIKEKKKQRLAMYLGDTFVSIISKEAINPFCNPSRPPEIVIAQTDVTASGRNKTVSPSISVSTGVA